MVKDIGKVKKGATMKIHNIEKGIKIPLRNSELYRLEEMEIGDSFLLEKTNEKDLRLLQRRIQPTIHYYSRNHNIKFKTRTMIKENGIRIWRVK